MSDLFPYDNLPTLTVPDLSGQIECTTELIGRGGCGTVYKGRWLSSATNTISATVAIKVIDLVPLSNSAKRERRFKQIKRELSLWCSIQHENILPLLGIARINDDTNVPAFVCPWMENGNAKEFCSSNPQFPPLRILYDIISGLQYLHTFDPEIVHGDIKAVNVLINNRYQACLCDFGLSRFLSDNTLWKTTATHASGTARWMAPELIIGDVSTPTKESDIYAYAMTCYEILSGEVPFKSVSNDATLIYKLIKGQRPDRIESFHSDFVWSIITRCWEQEPKDRLPTEIVLGLLRPNVDLGTRKEEEEKERLKEEEEKKQLMRQEEEKERLRREEEEKERLRKEDEAKEVRRKEEEQREKERLLREEEDKRRREREEQNRLAKEKAKEEEERREADEDRALKQKQEEEAKMQTSRPRVDDAADLRRMSTSATTSAPKLSSQLSSKSAWSKGSLQTASAPSSRSQSPAPSTQPQTSHSRRPSALRSGLPTPGTRMFDNAHANIQGGEFFNLNRDIYKIVINSGHDVMETLHAALPPLLEEIAKIQFQPIADEKTGINIFSSEVPAVIEMEAGPSSSLEIRSVADRYTRSMMKCLVGYPLYVPQPFSDFSEEVYWHKGVCVGDVGFITKDGAFNFLFNICPSQNSLINPRQLPRGFTLETREDSEINHKEQFPAKSHVFESPVSRTNSLLQGPKYTSSEAGGAILELPEGAFQDDATNMIPFRRLASRYGEQWYKYTIGTRGKDVLNGSLYLVTSCTKCTQWGIAVFDLPCTPQDSLRFVQNKGLFRDSSSKYSWKGSSTFTTKVAPSSGSNQGDRTNQCVFVQGYKIMLCQDIFTKIRNDLLYRRSQVQDTQRRKPTTGGVLLHTGFNLPLAHPSDLINSALLKQKTGARIALTHDNDWRDLVEDIFDNLENMDLAKIARSYGTSAIDENGCISFEKISDKPQKKPRNQPVTRFAGQREGLNNSKVPSVVCYDQCGNFIAAGSEADPETNPYLSDMNGVRRAEWFKLRLRPHHLAADKKAELQKLWLPPQPAEDEAHDEIDELLLEIEGLGAPIREPESARREMHFIPVTDDFKNPVQVFADFLRYLFKSAREYIIKEESNLDPTFSWTSIERNVHFVLTHPNGWEEEGRSKMREAAVMAGLVNGLAANERITFLTEGEANLHFCLKKNPYLQQERSGLLVVDCGGGTIDLSGYWCAEDGSFREIASPSCLLQGSIFVTFRARDYFKGRFKNSEFGSDDDVEVMAKAFDRPDGVKCVFSNPSIPYYVKFGGLRDTDPEFGILGGKFRLEGAQVARFFGPAVDDIIHCITDQCDRAKWSRSSIKTILLVGGFGSSDYLYTRLNDYFKPQGITIHRLDTAQLNKAVADGAISYYLGHMIGEREKSTERSI